MAYMPQDVFDMGAVTLALAKRLKSDSSLTKAQSLASSYRRHYEDEGLEADWEAAADLVLDFLLPICERAVRACGDAVEADAVTSAVDDAVTQLQYCIENYTPDGQRKPGGLRGTHANRSEEEISDKPVTCKRDIMSYHIFTTLTGTIPMRPKGWSLNGERHATHLSVPEAFRVHRDSLDPDMDFFERDGAGKGERATVRKMAAAFIFAGILAWEYFSPWAGAPLALLGVNAIIGTMKRDTGAG